MLNKRVIINMGTIVLVSIFLYILFIYSIYYGKTNPILINYRFTRVVSVVISGFVLGVAGSYLQGCLRNPLVDHYILGVGSGALFTVYLSIAIMGYNSSIASLFAVIGGLTALALTITIAETIGGTDASYILAGLGINSLFSGLSILLTYIVSTKYAFTIHLLIGSFIIASPKNHLMLIISLTILLISYPILAKPLNTLILGDQYALQLGYNPLLYRRLAVILAGVSSSIIVALYGLIGFIGLISPHIARFMIKTVDHRFTIILSGLNASILLLITDDISRIVLSDITGEIPAGAIVSVIGAPFFLFLVIKRFKRGLR